MDGRIHEGTIHQSAGGVGRNVADAIGKLGTDPFFISAVGNDQYGDYLLKQSLSHLKQHGVLVSNKNNTASCSVFCDKTGECRFIIADMKIHGEVNKEHISNYKQQISDSRLVVMDGNLSTDTMKYVLDLCRSASVPGNICVGSFKENNSI